MRPMPVKFEDAKDDPSSLTQQKQQQSSSSSGAATFSPTRRVGARGGPQLFAQKLFTLVEEEDNEIVEWLPDGLAFRVKDIQRFSCEVLEKYFNPLQTETTPRRTMPPKAFDRNGGGGGCGAETSGRGRTRGAAQADLRPIRRRRQAEDDGDDDYASGEDDEFAAEEGSRRSALRRRVDSGPATRGGSGMGAVYAQDSNSDESSNDDVWPAEGGNGAGQEHLSGGEFDDERLEWGGGYNNWRQQVPGSPERSPRELHHVSTPMTMTSSSSQSEYENSPGASSSGGGGGLDRTSSVGSSMASSLSFTSSPSHSEIMFHSSSPYQFNDCGDESGHSDSTSPMSIHSPVGQAPAANVMEEAAAATGNQVSPAQQRQHDNDLSLAAVVDATISGWGSPHQPSSLPHLEHFGWGAANVSVDAGTPWSDPSSASSSGGMPQQHQSAPHGSPHQEDFGFIDLFATNWDASVSSSSSSPSSSMDSSGMFSSSSSSSPDGGNDCGGGGGGGGAGGGGGNGADVGSSDAFLKEAQAAGVFGGVDDFLIPRSGGGGAAGVYGGPAEFA
eukprot:g9092.t1